MTKPLIAGIVCLMLGTMAQAETLSFRAAWTRINQDSAAQEASQLQTEALMEAQGRARRHWLPRIYLDAKSYQTNDPGASFFGLLSQRALQQSDFNPDAINHPDAQLYTRGALGLDLPLYEGGMRSSQADLLKHSTAAQRNSTSQIQLEQYSQVGLAYGSLVVLEQQRDRLQALSAEVVRMIKGYQLGSRSNPVGYSGLLGMKSLANRLSGLIGQYEAQTNSYYANLSEMGLKDLKWAPEAVASNAFVNLYLSPPARTQDTQTSYKIETAKENVQVSEKVAAMEKAKFLPRVGAFAETSVFNGDRDTASGYNAGVYLQWNLYNPSDYGSLKEAKLKTRAATKFTEASRQQERAERAALHESIKSLKENIDLLNDSYKLLIEQSKMTETLFRNGSINALQIVEVLNRRADLIAQQSEAELGLIKASAQLITMTKFDIGNHLGNGGKNEGQ